MQLPSSSVIYIGLVVFYLGYKYIYLKRTKKMPTPQQVEYVKTLINKSPVFIASKTYCPYCRSTKNTISQYPVKAEIIELNQRSM